MEAQRVLIVCEPGLLAQGMRSLVETAGRTEIVGVTGDARQAAELIRLYKPDVILVEADQFALQLGHAPQTIILDSIPAHILLSREDNVICTCHVEEKLIAASNDLSNVLTG